MASRFVHLPDCAARARPHALTRRQRRDLIRLLASEGPDALEAWLEAEERRDPWVRERLAEERDRLEREAREERERIEAASREELASHKSAWERRMERMAEREREVRSRLERLRGDRGPDRAELVARSKLFKVVLEGRDERPGLGRRVLRFLRRIWLWLVMAWAGLVRLVTGRRRREPTVLELPDGLRVDLGALLGRNPGLLVELRARIREDASARERMRAWWRRLTGREDYAALAQRLMEDELRRVSERHRFEMDAEATELSERLAALEREEDTSREQRAEELAQVETRRERRLEELDRRLADEPYDRLRDEVLDELREAGLVGAEGRPTDALLQRFSSLLYEEALRGLPAGGIATPGSYAGGEGEYEKGPLRSLNERGAVEVVDSLVRARTHHPRVRHLYDEDLMVHREVRTSTTHVVLVMDTSGSMEEQGRLEAAKRVCLVMYQAVKDQNPDHRVDLLLLSTGIERVDLAGCWNAEPRGFTNHGAALRVTRELFEDSGADRRIVYLITDGLPEAWTRPDGKDVVDRQKVCLDYAKEQAGRLAELAGTRLLILQLETEDPLYLEAARALAEAGEGTVEALDPSELTKRLLVDLETSAPVP